MGSKVNAASPADYFGLLGIRGMGSPEALLALVGMTSGFLGST